MYFKRLEIVGFKSFYHKTNLDFEPGITAIVGPNGCGKSNIFDSIRWVLGEQSVKALRGTDMQDVIFNGTESKEPLGMAEVTLVFDNSNTHFSVDHTEVAVTRRLYRSGESEYLLNKNIVRLKDILDLLMGTGIGAESYSLIQQGKIDLVLSAKPEDRRLVFDEASGISKYKAQKRETLRKLEDTEQNLLRVNDIVTEVKRQIGSLERQANKARRYKEAFEELKAREIQLASLEKQALLAQQEELSQTLSRLHADQESLQQGILSQESSISNRQQELKDLEILMQRTKEEILQLHGTESRNQEHIRFNEERIRELDASNVQLALQIEQMRVRIAADEEKLNATRQEYDGIAQAVQEKTALLAQREQTLAEVNASIKNSLHAISQTKQDILDAASRLSAVNNSIADTSSKKQVYAARQNRLTLEKAKIGQEYADMEQSLAQVSQELSACEAQFASTQARIAQTKEAEAQEKLSLNQLISRIEELVMQKLTLESHREFLSQLKSKYEDLGESLNATIYLDKLPSEKLGGMVVKIREYQDLQAQEGTPGVLKILGEAKPVDLDTQRISERIAETEQEIVALNGQKAQKEAATDEIMRSIAQLQEELRSQEITLANKRTNRQNLTDQCGKIREEEELILAEISDVIRDMTQFDAALQQFQAQQAELTARQKELEDSILHEQNAITAHNQTKEEALMYITQVKTELEALQKKKSSDEATIRILEETWRQDTQNSEALTRQQQEQTLRQEALRKEMADLERAIQEARAAVESHTQFLSQSRASYETISNAISDVVAKISLDRTALEECRQRMHDTQMKAKDYEFKYEGLKERILQGYKIDLDTLAAQDPESGAPPEEGALREEVRQLKARIDSYGAVNLVAIEEYDELKQRYDFLTQQQADLFTAKDSLHEAILKINRTTRKMFMETFEKVQVEFRNYFKLLFNGGEAQVYLLDESDPLESGIEIICRPPGKKLQNILLLSGGEKSMAAIALIFAIFKVKPAPFCVLDEIDAALDEANVDRFGRILSEFTNTSQFIVITHNKKTIANADVMYGITMEESGVSKIVSVKLSQSKEKKEDTAASLPQPTPA
jgi:chromosome segregation protein